MLANLAKNEIRKRCKGVHCVDLDESFPTNIYLQKLASIQPRTRPVKFARSPCTDPPGMDRSTPTLGRSTPGLSALMSWCMMPFRHSGKKSFRHSPISLRKSTSNAFSATWPTCKKSRSQLLLGPCTQPMLSFRVGQRANHAPRIRSSRPMFSGRRPGTVGIASRSWRRPLRLRKRSFGIDCKRLWMDEPSVHHPKMMNWWISIFDELFFRQKWWIDEFQFLMSFFFAKNDMFIMVHGSSLYEFSTFSEYLLYQMDETTKQHLVTALRRSETDDERTRDWRIQIWRIQIFISDE